MYPSPWQASGSPGNPTHAAPQTLQPDCRGLCGLAGIRSTGLTASPAIAEHVAGLYTDMFAASSSSDGWQRRGLTKQAPNVEPPYTPVPLSPGVRLVGISRRARAVTLAPTHA